MNDIQCNICYNFCLSIVLKKINSIKILEPYKKRSSFPSKKKYENYCLKHLISTKNRSFFHY